MRSVFLLIFFAAVSALGLEGKNPEGYFAERSREFFDRGQYEDALDYANQEIIDYPKNPTGYYQAAAALYALERNGQALSRINEAIKRSGKNKAMKARSAEFKVNLCLELGDTAMAMDAIKQGLKADKTNIPLMLKQGVLTAKTGDRVKGYAILDKAHTLDPYNPEYYRNRGELLEEDGRYAEALESYESALAIEPNAVSDLYNIAYLSRLTGDTQKCYDTYIRLWDMSDSYDNINNLILSFVDDAADRAYILSVIDEKEADNPAMLYLKAYLLQQWGMTDEAVAVWRKMTELGIAADLAYTNWVNLLMSTDPLESYRVCREGLEKYPDNQGMRKTMAMIALIIGKPTEALEMIEGLLAEASNDASLYSLKGYTLMNMGRYSEAVEPTLIATLLEDNIFRSRNYGDALRMSGNDSEAETVYRKIIADNPEVAEESLDELSYCYASLGMRAEAFKAYEDYVGFTEKLNDAPIGFNPDGPKMPPKIFTSR